MALTHDTSKLFQFGTEIVLAEPMWYQYGRSPYYTQAHADFRAKVRAFVEENFIPFADEWEEKHISEGFEVPLDCLRKAYAAGIYTPWAPAELGGTPPAGGWDAFMDLIWLDEIGRSGTSGVATAFTILTMALPPVLNSGNQYIIDMVARDCIEGKKFIALCISEPYAGSDVAGMRASAVRDPKDNDTFILNGEKKWITFGIHADYFTVAARTGVKGHKGLTMFLVPRNSPGVTVKRMQLQGHWLSGTSFVVFRDVRVPATHILGKEGEGFKQIVHNFNHERFCIAVQANRSSRGLMQHSIEYAMKRKTFGQRLLEHQVIRQKVADMGMRVEATHAMLENIAYQMQQGVKPEHLGGQCAMAKVFATRTLELCVREAAQLFGGAGYIRSGIGAPIERAGRDLRGTTIPGGSDEIMADFMVRQAMSLTVKERMKQANL